MNCLATRCRIIASVTLPIITALVLSYSVIPHTFGSVLQLVGGMLFLPGYLCQIWTCIHSRSTAGLSFGFCWFAFVAIGLMEVYALQICAVAFMFFVTNTMSLLLSTILLCMFIIFPPRREIETLVE